MRYLFLLLLISNFGVTAFAAPPAVQIATPETKAAAVESIDYFLSADRLLYYALNLSDFLDGKKDPSIVEALRSLTIEDIESQKIPKASLQTSSEWQRILFEAIKKKAPLVTVGDLEWNYNFYKNKLMTRFNAKAPKAVKAQPAVEELAEEMPVMRSVSKIKGSKYLLDIDRYISEKTTRAIFWDAIKNDRDFELHIGDQRDFEKTAVKNKIEILAEIQPRAYNYNKIYLTYNHSTGRYTYVINAISGEDRVKHLLAQFRMVKYGGKIFLNGDRDKVRIFGSAALVQKRQENALLDVYNRLPKADKIVIGQKGTIDTAIRTAGMMEVVKNSTPDLLNKMGLVGAKASKFQNLAQFAVSDSSFQLSGIQNSPVKLDAVYETAKDDITRNYQQFNSDQGSHEFADYLLEDKDGNIKRWRVISAVWGDEIIPIANALRRSGHNDIVYIGTAGAMAGKGISVGDVIPGTFVETHSNKKLAFSPGILAPKEYTRQFTVGQVHTPYEETDKWLKDKSPSIDIVEVETGYLREQLARDAKLEAYFLISDVVGSADETLAHAINSSSKRKNGQMKLLENLFVKNGIRAPISNYEIIPANPAFKAVLERMKALRPSREIESLIQVSHLAIRSGQTTDAEMEALLKSQPSFKAEQINMPLKTLGSLLAEIQSKIPRGAKVGINSEVLFNGTFNPQVKTPVKFVTPEGVSAADVMRAIGAERWSSYEKILAKSFEISIVEPKEIDAGKVLRILAKNPDALYDLYKNEVIYKAGFMVETDVTGKYRVRELPGSMGALRCSSVFM